MVSLSESYSCSFKSTGITLFGTPRVRRNNSNNILYRVREK